MNRRTRLRHWIAKRMHFAADRLSPETAFRGISPFTFTYEEDLMKADGPIVGVVREDGKGTLIWVQNGDTSKAWDEADKPVWFAR